MLVVNTSTYTSTKLLIYEQVLCIVSSQIFDLKSNLKSPRLCQNIIIDTTSIPMATPYKYSSTLTYPTSLQIPEVLTSSRGSTPHSSSNSGPRSIVRSSSSTSSSTSGQDKYFYRDKLVFDPDVYINNPSYSGTFLNK